MSATLKITSLGELSIYKGRKRLNGFPSKAAEALLFYLAVTQKPISREKLAEMFWANRTSTQALTNLRTILSSLKKEVGESLLITRDALGINMETGLWLDVTEFETQLKQMGFPDNGVKPTDPATAKQLQETLDLYQGDFLEGFYLRDGQGFEEWVILQRERFKRLAREGFRLLSLYYLEIGEYVETTLSTSRWQRLDPYDEEACRIQMWAFIRSGQRNAALQSYKSIKEKLASDLNVTPSPPTTELFEKIQNIDFPPNLNIPEFSTPFLGRKFEVKELEHLLTTRNARLVTITGPGGMGKTRLAVESIRFLNHRKPGQFLHGVYFISLDTVDTPQMIPTRLAETIGFTPQGFESLQTQLLNFLKNREMLLLLDNFEHLLDDAGHGIALIVNILRQAPNVILMVTSRERLNLYDEVVFDITGLDIPPEDATDVQEFSAVNLFHQSAQRIQRNYTFDAEEKKSVVRICQLVDGAPLAIELASSWLRQYTCAQIAAQIETDLDFLESPYSDMRAGHRSLRIVFEHSWSLLSPDEQRTFIQLAIFRGGFTLQAAEKIISLQNKGDTLLSGLVDKSILQHQPDGRYDIHPLLRQFSMEKLHASNLDLELLLDQYTFYYLTFLTELGDGESNEQRALIRPERDNIRCSWEHAIARRQVTVVEPTIRVLHNFFSAQSWFQEGIDLFQNAVDAITAQNGEPARSFLCELFGRKARMHIQIGQLDKAQTDLQQALAYLQDLDEPSRRSHILDSLAITNFYAGNYQKAIELAQENLEIAEQNNNLDGKAFALNFLGSCYKAQGNYKQCRIHFERAVDAYHSLNDEIGAAMVLNNLGNLLQLQEDLETAQYYYTESSKIFKAQDHIHGAATTLANAGKLAERRGDHELARKLLEESLVLKRKLNDIRGEALALLGLGDIDLQLEQYPQAAENFHQALTLAQQASDVQLMLELFTVSGLLALKLGRKDFAHHLLSYTLAHNGSTEEIRQKILLVHKDADNNTPWLESSINETASKAIKELQDCS